jgi:hypothetical protein
MHRRSSLLLLLAMTICAGTVWGQVPAAQRQQRPATPLSQDSDPVPSPDPDRVTPSAAKPAGAAQAGEVTKEGGRYTLTANAF